MDTLWIRTKRGQKKSVTFNLLKRLKMHCLYVTGYGTKRPRPTGVVRQLRYFVLSDSEDFQRIRIKMQIIAFIDLITLDQLPEWLSWVHEPASR